MPPCPTWTWISFCFANHSGIEEVKFLSESQRPFVLIEKIRSLTIHSTCRKLELGNKEEHCLDVTRSLFATPVDFLQTAVIYNKQILHEQERNRTRAQLSLSLCCSLQADGSCEIWTVHARLSVKTLKRNLFSGSDCSKLMSVSTSSPPSNLGFNLLREPFWIGIIVILAVIAVIGVVAFIRRKCIANFDVKCCLPYHSKNEEKGLSLSTQRYYASFSLRSIVEISLFRWIFLWECTKCVIKVGQFSQSLIKLKQNVICSRRHPSWWGKTFPRFQLTENNSVRCVKTEQDILRLLCPFLRKNALSYPPSNAERCDSPFTVVNVKHTSIQERAKTKNVAFRCIHIV